ncbi:MAG: NAD(P)H-hydrate dehydratase [Desulfobacteraceae bacterium]|nr:NAD(P)H-hydrate dehydratase [Desulfobacteraceae bacterium]
MYIVTAEEMQRMDRDTIDQFGIPGRVLMENAGRGATAVFLNNNPQASCRRVGVAAGRGNNGGDGFVIARYLFEKKISVTVFLFAGKEKLTGDAQANFTLLERLGVPMAIIPDAEAFRTAMDELQQQDIWIDAILGTGLTSMVRGFFKKVIQFINDAGKPVFSVDIPSGLNSDTGQPCGICINADTTATFAFAKCGHVVYPGVTHTGKLEVVDIGIPAMMRKTVGPGQFLITDNYVKNHMPHRTPIAHKGNTGHVLIIAGSTGKSGAAAMTAMTAVRSGAGLVTLGIPRHLNPSLESRVIEPMTEPLPESKNGTLSLKGLDKILQLCEGKQCLALGPGLGHGDSVAQLVRRLVVETSLPLVIDADGLNLLAGHLNLLGKLKTEAVLTPHPGEMARLTGESITRIQQDRIKSAREFAQKINHLIVLKGARTIVAHPDGRIFINPTGNSGMASGGMGDVLTGLIAGLIAQGGGIEKAVHTAVFLHGSSADALAVSKGLIGYTAREVMDHIPECLKSLKPHQPAGLPKRLPLG